MGGLAMKITDRGRRDFLAGSDAQLHNNNNNNNNNNNRCSCSVHTLQLSKIPQLFRDFPGSPRTRKRICNHLKLEDSNGQYEISQSC